MSLTWGEAAVRRIKNVTVVSPLARRCSRLRSGVGPALAATDARGLCPRGGGDNNPSALTTQSPLYIANL